MVEIRRLTLGPFQSNCYLVATDPGPGVLVVDPGDEDPAIDAALSEMGDPAAILLTHAHLDHVAGVARLKTRHDVPIYLHPADRPLYDRFADQAASFGLPASPLPAPEEELADGQRLEVAGIRLEVRHAPGHSPGGVVLAADGFAFVGDCIFAGSIGRTDLPGGDLSTLMTSIREQILTLPEETVLLSGHGPETTVSVEARSNPFLTGGLA